MWGRVLRAAARRAGLVPTLRSLRAKINVPRTVEINGRRIRVPEILGIRCTQTEPWMLDLLRRLLPLRAGAFIDVGANTGQTLIKLKALEPARTYIGFEPNPACVVYLSELIKDNGFEECHVLPIGLYSSDGVCVLNMYADDRADDSASFIEKPHIEIRSRMFVPVFRFETISGQLPTTEVAIVKIDAEVSELEVLTSMEDLLVRSRPIILMEILPVYTDSLKARQAELEKVLDRMRYARLRVMKTPDLELAGLTRIEEIPIHNDLTHCDYVLVPEESALSDRLADVPS